MRLRVVLYGMLIGSLAAVVIAATAAAEKAPDAAAAEEAPDTAAAEEAPDAAVAEKAMEEAPDAADEPGDTTPLIVLEEPETATVKDVPSPVTVEEVFDFPEIYSDQPLTFDRALLKGTIKKDQLVYYCLEITSQGGNRITPLLKRPGITFIVSRDFAKKLLAEVDAREEYTVRIRCAMERIELLGNFYWVADVNELDFYDGEGKEIVKTLKRETPVKQ